MAFKLGITVDLCMVIIAHARFNDLDARSQWAAKAKKSALNYFDN